MLFFSQFYRFQISQITALPIRNTRAIFTSQSNTSRVLIVFRHVLSELLSISSVSLDGSWPLSILASDLDFVKFLYLVCFTIASLVNAKLASKIETTDSF